MFSDKTQKMIDKTLLLGKKLIESFKEKEKEQKKMHKIVDGYLFFFKEKTPLSQWTRINFFEDGIIYNCAEAYMMYKKSILFNDKDTAEKILKAIYPSEQKKLGREVKNFDENFWIIHREAIVYQANLLKFSQNQELTEFLLDTGDLILCEASPNDSIWGLGVSQEDADPNDKSKWGLNLLGLSLMRVRDTLRYGRKMLKIED